MATSEDDLFLIRFLEGIRWPNGVKCLRCEKDRVRRLHCKGKNGRVRHLYWCADCGYEFSITVGTMFQGSHLPLNKWFHAIGLLHADKKGISAMQLSREIVVSYESAWSVAKRIRRAMGGEHAELCRRIANLHNSSQSGDALELGDAMVPDAIVEAETVLQAG
jgi:transposase-like protein